MIDEREADRAQIEMIIERRAAAVRARDVEGVVADVAADSVSFDVVNPLQFVGAQASRLRAQAWLASFSAAPGYEQREVTIAIGGDVAFSHSLNHVSGVKLDGSIIDMWWRATVGYRRIDKRWHVVHEHSSVPVDPQNGKGSMDLKP